MSGVILYYFPFSPPARVALLAARAVGVPVELKIVNTFKKEHLIDEIKKINPQHCIPTLKIGDFALWESRAIATYLVSKFAKDDKLYPKDLEKRAMVDQRMYFDSSFLLPKIRNIYYPVLFRDEKVIPQLLKDDLRTTLGFLDLFLEGQNWLAGDNYTLADTTIIASITTLQHMEPEILDGFNNIDRWAKQCSVTLPGYQENLEGAKGFGEYYRNKLES